MQWLRQIPLRSLDYLQKKYTNQIIILRCLNIYVLFRGLDSDVENLLHKSIATLRSLEVRSLGAEIKEIVIPELSLSTFAG